MARGKYSPTVSSWYSQDQDWHRKILTATNEVIYDHEGYDSYGYNLKGLDRAGYAEHEYKADEDLYSQIWEEWNDQPIPK